MAENSSSPLHSVNLRQQRRVNEPGTVEQLVVGPGGILGAEALADRIVLQHEERLQQRQPHPEPWLLRRLGDQLSGERAVRLYEEFAVFAGAHPLLGIGAAAVELGAV